MKAKLVNETIGDILKPKTQEEVDQELNKWTDLEKLDAVNDFYEHKRDDFLRDVEYVGGDVNSTIEFLIQNASKDNLLDIIRDLLGSEESPLEFLLSYIEDGKLLGEASTKYIDDANSKELEEVLNSLIKNQAEIIRHIEEPESEETWW